MDNKLLIPSSIILAGVIVAGALLYSRLPPSPNGKTLGVESPKTPSVEERGDSLKIREGDFVLGNPAAEVVLIEYGDFQCPFCGRFFKSTEQQIVDTYVKTGKAAFLWRDFAFLYFPESKQELKVVSFNPNVFAKLFKFWSAKAPLFSPF